MNNIIAEELSIALQECMGITPSPFVTSALVSQLLQISPANYEEIMVALITNTERYAKPIEKIGIAIQKVRDRYTSPDDVEGMLEYVKRNFKGRIISDCVTGLYLPGTKIAVSVEGEFVNMLNGERLSESETVAMLEWCLHNTEKLGAIKNCTSAPVIGHSAPAEIEHHGRTSGPIVSTLSGLAAAVRA